VPAPSAVLPDSTTEPDGPRPEHIRRAGALRPAEIANAGVFAALAVVIVSVGAFLPRLGAIELLAVVPFAIAGLRNRLRAVVAAAVAAGFVAFLVTGLTSTFSVAGCAALGGFCGITRRRGHGLGLVSLAAAGVAPVAAAAAVGILSVFSAARNLTFESLRASVAGTVRIAAAAGVPPAAARAVLTLTDELLRAWPVAVAAAVLVAVPAGMLLTSVLVTAIARRVEWLARTDPLDYAARADAELGSPVAPVPLELDGAGLRHPGTPGRDALADVSLTVAPGEFVAVVGPNGAGKSTLVSLLAGAQPTTGTVRRPGRVGLGLPGGTAIVAQRAETQVIGSTVEEDLRWGLPPAYPVDVRSLLAGVGLDGLAAASTESLSGGQLQRLAIASALARRPSLLISDESTSMLDAAGRAEILGVLKALAQSGTAVVHVTHDPAETAHAGRVITLADGRVADTDDVRVPPLAEEGSAGTDFVPVHGPAPGPDGDAVIRVRGAGHRFDPGTPWEVTALRSVSLDVRPGEGLLITGANGSGKTTLAWVLAGLIRPTDGTVTIDGAPAHESVGAVALSFQHARLQLQRPTVAEDILAAAGPGAAPASTDADGFVRDSLRRVGLPADLAGRSIDELSGGQARRVAIAGLLASRPRVLVLDEPLAGLDREARRGLIELLGRMRREEDLTLIVISHDLEDMGLACTRSVEVTDGTVLLPGTPEEPPPASRPARRGRTGFVFRAVPGTSPLHRLGPAVKLVGLAVVTVTALLLPGWPAIAVLGALAIAAGTAARLPWSVVPRLPWWALAVTAFFGVTAAAGNGLAHYAESLLLLILFLALSLLVVWTTRVEELPAAFVRIVSPLRAVRAPVDEWAHTLTLAVRTLPLLHEEIRVLVAARRLRPRPKAAGPRDRITADGRELLDLVVAVVASAGRRASDLGRAATQRGGMRPVRR